MSRYRRWALLVIATVLAVPAALFARAESQPVGGVAVDGGHTYVEHLRVDGRTRSYRFFVPDRLPPGRRPLLLALHYLGGSAAKFQRASHLDAGAVRRGALIAYPDGWHHSWDAGTCCGDAAATGVDDVAFLAAVVRDASRREPVDAARLAITGYSNGGLMSYRLVCERAGLVHVAVAMAGDLVAPRCSPSQPVDLLHVHGLVDRVIAYAGATHAAVSAAGFPAASASVNRIATADGCADATAETTAYGAVWRATSCHDDVAVTLVTSRALGHAWPTGPSAASRFGVDMSRLPWTFIDSAWRR